MKKLLLTSLMVSVMGFSSLFAGDVEASCGCDHAKVEVQDQASCQKEGVGISFSAEDEKEEIKVLSCGDCDRGERLAEEEEAEEFSLT